MKRSRPVFVCLLAVGLLAACPSWPATTAVADDREGRELISEGLGLRGVYVGRSTADDVAATYGKDFELVEQGAQSSEMRYAALGLSFFYCRADERKRIYEIECRAPFRGFTARGVILGESSARDVLKAYGQAEPTATTTGDAGGASAYAYPGVRFRVEDRQPGRGEPLNKLLGRKGSKVVAIDVVTLKGGSDCLPQNVK
ncbi:MAG TPA: hypothetical protein VM864_07285 [Pyrinomonadaceae bacterium]|nr:hypothetical protein [Pyrinomonadaceae bacterium]